MPPFYGIIYCNYLNTGELMAKFKPKKEGKQQEVAITVRLPEDIHKRLAKFSDKEDLSINKMITQMIEHCLNEANG